jgi:hypothetical protein
LCQSHFLMATDIGAGGSASEQGGSIAIINGVGLGELGLDWVNVGPHQNLTSVDYDVI